LAEKNWRQLRNALRLRAFQGLLDTPKDEAQRAQQRQYALDYQHYVQQNYVPPEWKDD
jgi:hypothetical protein